MNESFKKIFVMSWNVRGLGDPDKCTIVHDAISDASPTIVCLQETKLHDMPHTKTHSFLPSKLANNF